MSRSRAPFKRLLLCTFIGLAPGLSAQAQSLLELYQAAQGYDASYQAAQAQFDATSAKSEQVQALYAPVVSLQGTAKQDWSEAKSYTETTNSTTDKFETTSALSLSFSQTVYSKLNELSLTSAQRSAALVELALVTARQDLMVRVSSAYFDVLAARDSLEFVRAQKPRSANSWRRPSAILRWAPRPSPTPARPRPNSTW